MEALIRSFPHLPLPAVIAAGASALLLLSLLWRRSSARRGTRALLYAESGSLRRLAMAEIQRRINEIKAATSRTASNHLRRSARTNLKRIQELVRRHGLDWSKDIGVPEIMLVRSVANAIQPLDDPDLRLLEDILSGKLSMRPKTPPQVRPTDDARVVPDGPPEKDVTSLTREPSPVLLTGSDASPGFLPTPQETRRPYTWDDGIDAEKFIDDAFTQATEQ